MLCINYVPLPLLATLRSIKIASFGNFWSALLLIGMPNIGETVTQVLYIKIGKNVQSFIEYYQLL